MSILLDALKKSEAQRRLGETPTIHSGGSEGTNSEARESRWIPAALLAVSAIAIVWFGWQQFREPVMDSDLSSPEQLVDAAQETESFTTAPREETGPGGNAEADAGSASDSGAAAKPDLDAVARQPRAQPRTPVEDYRPEPGSESDAGTAARAPAGAAAVDAAQEMPDAQPAQPALAEVAEAADIAPMSAPSAGKSESRPMERHIPEPVSYWELPQGIRDILPELKITVLVYAERPEDRFALVNGERLVEEQELDEEVKLEEIRREGVVFLFRNYRFLVKG